MAALDYRRKIMWLSAVILLCWNGMFQISEIDLTRQKGAALSAQELTQMVYLDSISTANRERVNSHRAEALPTSTLFLDEILRGKLEDNDFDNILSLAANRGRFSLFIALVNSERESLTRSYNPVTYQSPLHLVIARAPSSQIIECVTNNLGSNTIVYSTERTKFSVLLQSNPFLSANEKKKVQKQLLDLERKKNLDEVILTSNDERIIALLRCKTKVSGQIKGTKQRYQEPKTKLTR